VISEGVEVQADEAHSGVRAERILGLPGDRVADDEDVVETDVVEEDAAAEVLEELEDEGFVVGAYEDMEDGDEGGARVVEVWLAAGPVEELEAREDGAVGGGVAEDAEDEALGER